ncbi:DASH complex subunit Spc19 [Tirmania nivea]|nr:DASH complex subunit Spc19 [Tirmania nivea]
MSTITNTTTTQLQTSVNTLTASLSLLTSTISTLSTATSDFPRMTKVLTVNRHFELLSEPEIQTAQESLREEIVPEFRHLLGRVEGQLERMERREKGLESRGELLGGRLEGMGDGKRKASVSRGSAGGIGFAGGLGEAAGAGSKVNVEKMRQLKAKKERLMYTVERLALQKGQKHRQLRMSMSYKGVV